MPGRRAAASRWPRVALAVLSLAVSRVAWAAPPPVSARAVVVMDARSGQVLWAKNPDLHLPPASTTKMLTLIVALRTGAADDRVTVPADAPAAGGTSLGLAAGQVYTLGDLEYGMMLRSANDAAVTIADFVGGSVPAFADLMNQVATEIGARESNFENPSGMPQAGHFSTARDLAIIARWGLGVPAFRAIVTAPRYAVRPLAGRRAFTVRNENRFLLRYRGATGVKSGWTEAAGPCLVASADRGGHELIAVELNDPNVWADASRLLDWGFGDFRWQTWDPAGPLGTVTVTGGTGPDVPVRLARAVVLAAPKAGPWDVRVVSLPGPVPAPVKAGQPLGNAVISVRGAGTAAVPVVAAATVPTVGGGWWQALLDILWRWTGR